MVFAAGEKTPLRVGEEGDGRQGDASSSGTHHGVHRVSYQDSDAAALRSGSPGRGVRSNSVEEPSPSDVDRRRAVCGVMRSMGAAATMAATAAALVVMVWTQRTHTLQDSWRPVPGLDLDFTFGAGEAGAGARGFASRVMGGISQGNGGGLVDAEARLGASEANVPPSAPTKFYLYDEIYALFEPVVACATRADEHAHLGDLDALRVNAELEFYKSLQNAPVARQPPVRRHGVRGAGAAAHGALVETGVRAGKLCNRGTAREGPSGACQVQILRREFGTGPHAVLRGNRPEGRTGRWRW